MRDQTVVADAELALHPTIFVDFRVERARRQRRELARGPFEIDHCACGLELLPGGRAYGREALLLSSTIIAGAPARPRRSDITQGNSKKLGRRGIRDRRAPQRAVESRALPGRSAAACYVTLSSRHSIRVPLAGGSAPLSRSRFVDAQSPPTEIFPVELRDRGLRFALVRHLHEPEAARPTGLAIHEDFRGGHFTKSTEGIAKLAFGHAVGQISDVDIHHHRLFTPLHTTSSSTNGARSSARAATNCCRSLLSVSVKTRVAC